MYIDCHAHLFFTPFQNKIIETDIIGEIPNPSYGYIKKMIKRAKEREVNLIIGVISNPDDFYRYKEQLKLDDVGHIIGISRNHSFKDHDNLIFLLEAEIEKCIPHGIGEIGLDYSYNFNKLKKPEIHLIKQKQQDLFRKQIRLAKEYDIPIVVHAGYNTDKDIVKVIKEENAQDVSGQIHGYMCDKDLVIELLDLGFYFSLGYLHIRDEELKKIVEITPLERILTETDAPYHLLESPKRFILPEDVIFIAQEIANLKETNLKDFNKQVYKNVKSLFQKIGS